LSINKKLPGQEIAFLGTVKGRIRTRLGMVNIENVIIALLILVSMGFQYIFLRIYVRIAKESTVYLDASLAEALTTILESLPDVLEEKFGGQIEPVNPIQALIAQYLGQQINPPITGQVLTRSEDGKFAPKDTS
tara:strand:+ start:2539 stop:2940 length:402 start_codon:yes stop_codon:yes gene_type:complete